MNGNHTEEEKRNKKNKTKTKRNENEKLEEISECRLSQQYSNRFFSSDSIFEPREAGAGDMSATDREIEQFKQFCLDSKYVSRVLMLAIARIDDPVFRVLNLAQCRITLSCRPAQNRAKVSFDVRNIAFKKKA